MLNAITDKATKRMDEADMAVYRDAGEAAAGMTFEAALARFLDETNDMMCEHAARMGFHFRSVVHTEMGKRYVRFWVKDNTADADPNRGSAYCFVDTMTGDILKPAGWKGPAKGYRGNIFKADRRRATGPYGTTALR